MAMSKDERAKSKREFNKINYDLISLYLPKGKNGEPGMKDVWKESAKEFGVSLGAFIKQCVNEKISKDKDSEVKGKNQ